MEKNTPAKKGLSALFEKLKVGVAETFSPKSNVGGVLSEGAPSSVAENATGKDTPAKYLDYPGMSHLVDALKETFTPKSHAHSAGDISTGTLPISRGGTGQTSALNSAKALGRGYGTCGTVAATAAKTVSLANFSRQTGAIVAIKFTYANTATKPTLNVNSTGAAPIYSCYTNAAITAGNIAAGMTALFAFNGAQWVLLNPAASGSSSKT